MIYTIFSPHSPLLIDKITPEKSKNISNSIKSWEYIRDKIYEIDPDKIFLILPSYKRFNNISINQSESFMVDFKEFGDLSVKFHVNGDLDLSTRLKYFLRQNNINVNLYSKSEINYKAFVPLYYLDKYHIHAKGLERDVLERNVDTEFCLINCSESDLSYHLKFGELFSNFLKSEKGTVLVIACGDLVKNNKDNLNYDVDKFVDNFFNIIKNKSYLDILQNESEFNKPYFYGVKPFVSIIPLVSSQDLTPKILSVDKEFEEVYMTVEFI
ncbi:MAG: hypothetical protein PHZ07_05405 [Patescibacteria group bacterium]|nr:hypothetical protein [Patescibacteria group bacterium]MDD4304817.1 hypothetical protein [Patescibacteria group bacterium]MDD4695790.1 hypothetical protein [Patescibacteria group bacterium]